MCKHTCLGVGILLYTLCNSDTLLLNTKMHVQVSCVLEKKKHIYIVPYNVVFSTVHTSCCELVIKRNLIMMLGG
jgi:hypothetical protein